MLCHSFSNLLIEVDFFLYLVPECNAVSSEYAPVLQSVRQGTPAVNVKISVSSLFQNYFSRN